MKAIDIIGFLNCLPDDAEVKIQNVYMDMVEVVDVKQINVKVLGQDIHGDKIYEIIFT